jgi:cytochrome c553
MLAGTLPLGAACHARPEPAPPPPAHYEAWDALVDAAWHGDTEAVGTHLEAMIGGPPVDGATGPAAEADATLGGALGFLRVAQTPDDLAMGITRAASACGACHAAEAVPAPLAPEWSHPTAAAWAVDAVVWHRPDVPRAAVLPAEAGAALASDGAAARARSLLVACAGCHGPQGASGPVTGDELP